VRLLSLAVYKRSYGKARYYDIPHHKNLDLRPARQISHRLDRPRMDQQIARWSVIALARRSPNRWWIGRDVRTE
jgi:hypothetical protein